MTKYKYVTTRIINLLRSLQSPSESIFGTIKSTFQNTQFRSKRPGYQIWWDKRGSDLSMSESVFTIFQNYYICVRVFEKCDSMSAAARAINFMSAISISPMSVSVYTTVLIHAQLSAVLEQRFRCFGHGGIRL